MSTTTRATSDRRHGRRARDVELIDCPVGFMPLATAGDADDACLGWREIERLPIAGVSARRDHPGRASPPQSPTKTAFLVVDSFFGSAFDVDLSWSIERPLTNSRVARASCGFTWSR